MMYQESQTEAFVPYDQSSLWDQHYAYYEEKGLAAWGPGGIPSHSTNNYAIARQHSRFLCAVYIRQLRSQLLTPDDPFYVLEIGAGLGLFAANLMTALATDCGSTGRSLVHQLRYVLTEYHEAGVHNALRHPRLAPWKKQLQGAVFDIRERNLRTLDGQEVLVNFSAVYANYVCCVSPTKLIRQTDTTWEEMHVRVTSGKTETAWREIREIKKIDRAVLTSIVKQAGRFVTVPYPYTFMALLAWLPSRMLPSGCCIISDFGFPPGLSHLAHAEPESFQYGDTLNHQVHFGMFTELAHRQGWATYTTKDPMRSVQFCCIEFSTPASPILTHAFKTNYEDDHAGERLIRLWTAVQENVKQRDFNTAYEYCRQCAELDPYDKKIQQLARRIQSTRQENS